MLIAQTCTSRHFQTRIICNYNYTSARGLFATINTYIFIVFSISSKWQSCRQHLFVQLTRTRWIELPAKQQFNFSRFSIKLFRQASYAHSRTGGHAKLSIPYHHAVLAIALPAHLPHLGCQIHPALGVPRKFATQFQE